MSISRGLCGGRRFVERQVAGLARTVKLEEIRCAREGKSQGPGEGPGEMGVFSHCCRLIHFGRDTVYPQREMLQWRLASRNEYEMGSVYALLAANRRSCTCEHGDHPINDDNMSGVFSSASTMMGLPV